MSKHGQRKPGAWPSASKGARLPVVPDLLTGSPVSKKKSSDNPRRFGRGRVATYLNLGGRRNPEPEPSPLGPSTGKTSSGFLRREEDSVFYCPNVEQMVESVQAGLMRRGTWEPIPLQHNSCVLSLIDDYWKKNQTIKSLESKITEAEDAHQRTKEHTKELADEWLSREKQYKAEIKRLELLLASTSQEGVAAVSLARAGSVVDRHGPEAKKLQSELRRLSDHKLEGKLISEPPSTYRKHCAYTYVQLSNSTLCCSPRGRTMHAQVQAQAQAPKARFARRGSALDLLERVHGRAERDSGTASRAKARYV